MYPAFVNCTTIDWFSEWPVDALLEVADKYLDGVTFNNEEEVKIIKLISIQFYLLYYFFVWKKAHIAQNISDV